MPRRTLKRLDESIADTVRDDDDDGGKEKEGGPVHTY